MDEGAPVDSHSRAPPQAPSAAAAFIGAASAGGAGSGDTEVLDGAGHGVEWAPGEPSVKDEIRRLLLPLRRDALIELMVSV